MEEDIKILEELSKNNYYGDVTFTREAEAIENLLKAYKQDEKMIELMANYILKNTCVLQWDGYESKVIEYFRKRCLDEKKSNEEMDT